MTVQKRKEQLERLEIDLTVTAHNENTLYMSDIYRYIGKDIPKFEAWQFEKAFSDIELFYDIANISADIVIQLKGDNACSYTPLYTLGKSCLTASDFIHNGFKDFLIEYYAESFESFEKAEKFVNERVEYVIINLLIDIK